MRKALALIGLMLCSAFRAQAQVPVALAPVPAQQFFSSTGVPLASGCIFTYITGTSTPLATYVDGTGGTVNTNPIILDVGGFGNIWLSNASYRFVIYSTGGVNCASGVLQRTVDNVSAYTIINQAQNLFLTCGTSDPSGSAGELGCRSDLSNKLRYFSTLWDSVVTETNTGTLTNKTFDISANTLKTSANVAGHYPRNTGTQYVDSVIQAADLPANAVLVTPVTAGVNAQTSATYTILASDEQKLVTLNNAGGTTVTLPQATTAGFGAGTVFHVRNIGATGTVLLNPTVSTIDGTAQLSLSPGQGADIYSDGANYATQKGGVSSEVTVGGATTQNFNATTNEDTTGTTVFFLVNPHILTRLLVRVDIAGVTCATAAIVALKDVNTSSITILTLPVNPSVGTIDSGAVAVTMTGGHLFALIVNAAATGCGTFPQGKILAVYQ